MSSHSEKIQECCSSQTMMMKSCKQEKHLYTEADAARALGISISKLHKLLDEHVFNDGMPRPAEVTFEASDLVLVGFWNRTTPNAKVVRMPRRA